MNTKDILDHRHNINFNKIIFAIKCNTYACTNFKNVIPCVKQIGDQVEMDPEPELANGFEEKKTLVTAKNP